MWFDQDEYDIRCEWGENGVTCLAPRLDAIIIVDILSFSTCVDVATARGATVYPYRWKDDSAAEFARDVGAVLAGPRSRDGRDGLSLSPASLEDAPRGAKIVLPSPNGATLSGLAGDTATFAGCLRNAASVAHAASRCGPRIGVVPAGERWPDGSLRPSLEDWLGAGAIIQHLRGSLSPEANAARAAFETHAGELALALHQCASGRELIEQGWERDVVLAGDVDVSHTAPMLVDRGYQTPTDRHQPK